MKSYHLTQEKALSEIMLSQFFPYGAPELKQFYQRFMTKGFIIAVILHLTGIALYHAPDWLRARGILSEEPPPMRTVRIMKYSELGPPPSITNTSTAPRISAAALSVKPQIGFPVPVPDARPEEEPIKPPPEPILPGDGEWPEIFIEREETLVVKSTRESRQLTTPPPEAKPKLAPQKPDIASPLPTESDAYVFDSWKTDLFDEEKTYVSLISSRLVTIHQNLHQYSLKFDDIQSNYLRIPHSSDNSFVLFARSDGHFRIVCNRPVLSHRALLEDALSVVANLSTVNPIQEVKE